MEYAAWDMHGYAWDMNGISGRPNYTYCSQFIVNQGAHAYLFGNRELNNEEVEVLTTGDPSIASGYNGIDMNSLAAFFHGVEKYVNCGQPQVSEHYRSAYVKEDYEEIGITQCTKPGNVHLIFCGNYNRAIGIYGYLSCIFLYAIFYIVDRYSF